MSKTHAFSGSLVWSVIADLFVLGGFAWALMSGSTDILSSVVRDYYPWVFVIGNFVFFLLGYWALLTSQDALKAVAKIFKKWNGWAIGFVFGLLGFIHALLYLFVFAAGGGPDGVLQAAVLTFGIVGCLGIGITGTVFIGDKYEFKLKPETLRNLVDKHPAPMAALLASSALLAPIPTAGIFLYSLNANKLMSVRRSPHTRSETVVGTMHVLLGLFLAMLLSFEILGATQGFEIETQLTSLTARVLIVALLWYLPYKLFIQAVDTRPHPRFELLKSLVVVGLQVVLIYVFA